MEKDQVCREEEDVPRKIEAKYDVTEEAKDHQADAQVYPGKGWT